MTFSNPLGKDGLKLVESEMIFCRSGVFVTGAGSITSLGIMGFSLGIIGLLATIFSIDSNLGGKISTASSMAWTTSWPFGAFKGSCLNEKLCKVNVGELATKMKKRQNKIT